MSTPWESPIIRVSTGYLNTVSDLVIGGEASIGSRSRYQGQLGKHLFVDATQIATLFNATVGTLYGGRYRYVRRRSTDDASPAVAPGKIAFWDTVVTAWQTKFQVTTDADLSSASNAMMRAGIFIGNIEPGEYGFICDMGLCNVRFRSVLTAAGAIGGPAYAADVGDTGDDQGTADALTTDSTALANARFLGWQVAAASGGGLSLVALADDAFVDIF